MRVFIYEDPGAEFHYQLRPVGVPDAKKAPTLCGLEVQGLRSAAWFAVGDRRGRVHYDRACAECRARLEV